MKFSVILFSQKSRLPLFSAFVLGIGILVGVFFPCTSFKDLFAYESVALLVSFLILKKSKITTVFVLIFSLGFYIAQTGGILETKLLTQKKFLEKTVEKAIFYADVDYIEETHPTMKNMRRISFKNINFKSPENLSFIKTAKMTCPEYSTENILPNDRVKVIARLLPFKISAIPGSFDQRQYHALMKINSSGVAFYIQKLKDGETKANFAYFRRIITKKIVEKLEAPAGGIASALLTGDKSSIPTKVRDNFINSGTAHILAISGLHMSIIASIVFFVFFKIFCYANIIFPKINPRSISAILTIPLTFLYLGLSGFSPSAIRAFIMTTVFLLSIILKKSALSLRSVIIAAFLIMLFDSGALFSVSFQLSFCAVVALISFYETFKDFFAKIFNGRNKFFGYIFGLIITTLIANVATFPVSASTFNRLSLSGVLGNLIAIPATSMIIMPIGMICLIFGSFCEFLLNIYAIILNFFSETLGFIANLPGSNIAVKSPNLITLYIIIFGGILLCLLKDKIRCVGIFLISIGGFVWFFEKKPMYIIPPKTAAICYVENKTLFTTSLQKGRNKILSIQRNLGFSGKLIKKNITLPDLELKEYDRGLFFFDNDFSKPYEIASNKHPFCPAFLTQSKKINP